MNNNSMPLAIAVAIALASLGTAPPAAAVALGEVAALSAMGESFRAEIRLPDGKPADAEWGIRNIWLIWRCAMQHLLARIQALVDQQDAPDNAPDAAGRTPAA